MPLNSGSVMTYYSQNSSYFFHSVMIFHIKLVNQYVTQARQEVLIFLTRTADYCLI